jgi:hypothetical protein
MLEQVQGFADLMPDAPLYQVGDGSMWELRFNGNNPRSAYKSIPELMYYLN